MVWIQYLNHIQTVFQSCPRAGRTFKHIVVLSIVYQSRLKVRLSIRKKRWMHTEMGMVSHLISKDIVAQTFAYLGISKKTYLMCGHNLQSLGLFQARNNYSKVYSQWTLPRYLVILSSYQAKLDSAVRSLRDMLRHECAVKDDQYINAVKESTIPTPVAPETTE